MLAYEDLMDYSERLMRDAIRALPDGDYAAETHIDGFLDDAEPTRRDLPIKVTLKVRGDEHHRRSHRHRAAGRRTGRSTCRSKARSIARSG